MSLALAPTHHNFSLPEIPAANSRLQLLPLFDLAVPEITSVVSVEGDSAHLPCDISPPHPKERVHIVLWYRSDEGEPIYR